MMRIQKYNVGLKLHGKEFREEANKQVDAFGTAKGEKPSVPKRLRYADPQEGVKYLQTTALHKIWFDTEKRYAEAKHTQSFLGWIKWKAVEDEEMEEMNNMAGIVSAICKAWL